MNWLAAGLLAVTALVLAVLLYRARRRYAGLRRSIDEVCASIAAFLADPVRADYSLAEDDLAQVKNAVAGLEDAYLQTQSLLASEHSRNHHFIADVSHQLKTPLAGLKLYVELAGGVYLDKEMQLIERMEKLIWQLLRMEKLRAGAYEFHFEPVELSGLAADIWQELSGLYPAHRLDIQGVATVRIDPIWLREALHNVIRNSCEQPPGATPIQVRLDQTESIVSIEIEDASGGVTDIDNLFARFNRLSPEDSKQNSGLGLAITKTIIERHHGSIFAVNTPHGLKTSIYLPVHTGYRAY